MTALSYYHKAHFLKNEDSLIEDLISKAMEDICNTDMHPISTTFLRWYLPITIIYLIKIYNAAF
jgi:hypothetical protein